MCVDVMKRKVYHAFLVRGERQGKDDKHTDWDIDRESEAYTQHQTKGDRDMERNRGTHKAKVDRDTLSQGFILVVLAKSRQEQV